MENFVGATDSAVPCAMLMYAALALDKFLNARDAVLTGDELEDPVGLQVSTLREDCLFKIILFDGEEAVNTWTQTDSVYGSRYSSSHFCQNAVTNF
jgi:glutaminyl-peptide cyclotransferase